MSSLPWPASPPEPPLPISRAARLEVLRWLGTYGALCLVVGGLGGLFWRLVVRLPRYSIREGGRATIGERDMAAIFAVDAWFVITGVMLGMGLGWVAWRWFRPLGWPLTFIAIGGSLVAALTCWAFPLLLAPAPLKDRLWRAEPGDAVAVDFTLHAPIAVVAWAAAAMMPILIAACFSRHHDDVTT